MSRLLRVIDLLVSRSLNRIQSKIYQTAFHSNVNLLVCAPTGAGKTNIAMTAVLHEVHCYSIPFPLNQAWFSISLLISLLVPVVCFELPAD